MMHPRWVGDEAAMLGVFQKASGQARMQRVRSRHRSGEIVDDQVAGHTAEERPRRFQARDHILQLLAVRRPDETMPRVRQHDDQRHTTLRLPVAGSVIIPSRPKSTSATSPGSVSAIRTVRALRRPQLRFLMNRRNDVYDTVHPRASSNS